MPIFKTLKTAKSIGGESNYGGDFALPAEFDTKLFASAFVPKGNAVTAKKNPETLVGTNYTAPGWSVWKDSKGKMHVVRSKHKDGGSFVLMCRDIEVQREVNAAYGQVSRERMINEAVGKTVATADKSDDPGMLGRDRLPAEREDEPYEPPIAVEEVSLPTSQKITKKSKTLTQ